MRKTLQLLEETRPKRNAGDALGQFRRLQQTVRKGAKFGYVTALWFRRLSACKEPPNALESLRT